MNGIESAFSKTRFLQSKNGPFLAREAFSQAFSQKAFGQKRKAGENEKR